MGITLFLMSQKGLAVLNAVIENKFTEIIDKVVVGTDKNVVNDFSKNIVQLCEKEKLSYCYRLDDYTVNTEFSIAISWRWLINLPKNKKLIVLHDSLLPKYRGFAPLVNALKNGEKFIGVTALYASKEYDRGDIIKQQKIEILYPIKIEQAILKVSALYQEIVVDLFKDLNNNKTLDPKSQDNSEATYSLWLDEQDYKIDWTKEASYIERFVNATGFPYKGAKSVLNGEWVTIVSVKQIEDVYVENRDVGKTIFLREGKPVVVCGRGLLIIQEAKYNKNNKSIFPLKSFRNRFL
ncbi:methionyl-tRNA formyltransferase [Hyunsoonleella jejuensis]|uniref:Methionyl-tRNA formyltransferase n=1 Tax=Hyunsoonleella jejuensis TaxID=419940 RepID=A0A1H9D8E4_9FLAO|nr:formyltransferase family protein [Hyunsoonleella jejuensis]SEQ09736.1 methionyl-tRNA formyltransferase [Hyunsoonleella jejuensis]